MKFNKAAGLAWGLCSAIILTLLVNAGRDLLQDNTQGNTQTAANTVVWSLIPIVFAVVGALIISKQARNVIGWLVMLPALVSGLNGLATLPLHGMAVAPSEPSLALLFALWFANSSWVLIVFPLFFIALLFPTGKPLSPRWRWAIGYGIGMIVFFYLIASLVEKIGPDPGTFGVEWTVKNPIGFIPSEVTDAIFSLWWGIALAMLALLSAVSLVLRYRRATGVEREQIKWLLTACIFFALSYMPLIAAQGEGSGILWTAMNLFFAIGVFGFPIAIGIAILRYRLYDIDIIIRRTLIYSIITAMLAVFYFGSVIVLQQLLQPILGQNSDIAIIISTLAIAALFNPLRRRVQKSIDHRFYRRKYDAQQVLARFAQTARDEVELEKLTGELLNVVNETMQPTSVSLWLKKTGQ